MIYFFIRKIEGHLSKTKTNVPNLVSVADAVLSVLKTNVKSSVIKSLRHFIRVGFSANVLEFGSDQKVRWL